MKDSLPSAPDKSELLGLSNKREEALRIQKQIAEAKAALVAQEAAAIQHEEVRHFRVRVRVRVRIRVSV